MREKQYFIYILTNHTNKVLYVGITKNLKSRVYEHKSHTGSIFTTKYNINKLIYYEIFKDPENAIKREKYLKNLLRRKKEHLIKGFNPKWKDLYENL